MCLLDARTEVGHGFSIQFYHITSLEKKHFLPQRGSVTEETQSSSSHCLRPKPRKSNMLENKMHAFGVRTFCVKHTETQTHTFRGGSGHH